ncbi:MAG: YitT family protein [Clostridiales bacterium]|nr:YitT family protein [Clostridiales bacterium]
MKKNKRKSKIKKRITRKSVFNFFKEIIILTIGSLLYSISIAIFIDPNNMAPGGVTGIAILVNKLFPVLNTGILVLILNLPLLIWATIGLGFKFLAKTIYSTIVTSVAITFFENPYVIPAQFCYKQDPLLAALFGGVIGGAGLALVLTRNATTGGTDIVARMANKSFPHFSVGKLLLGVDGMVVLASAFVFQSVESPMYSIIVLFIYTKVIDGIMYIADSGTGKIMFIVTKLENENAIKKLIFEKIDRSVTVFESRGGYSNADMVTLMCAVKPNQVNTVYRIVRMVDEKAFTVVSDAHEVTGEGWREWSNRLE